MTLPAFLQTNKFFLAQIVLLDRNIRCLPYVFLRLQPKHQPDLGLDDLPAELLNFLSLPFQFTHRSFLMLCITVSEKAIVDGIGYNGYAAKKTNHKGD